jgi:hypothetical protein
MSENIHYAKRIRKGKRERKKRSAKAACLSVDKRDAMGTASLSKEQCADSSTENLQVVLQQ